MTYGVGMVLEGGFVLAADTRTNAGVDNIATFKKLHVWERKGERVLMLVTAGNLAVAQAAVALLGEEAQANRRKDARPNLFSAPNMFQAARVVGTALRDIRSVDGEALTASGDFSATLLLGGQIGKERPRLFLIYAEGNFIEATEDTPFLQVGETQIRQADPRPRRGADDVARTGRQARASVVQFDLAIQSVGRPAHRSHALSTRLPDRRRPTAHRQGRPLLQEALERLVEGVAERLRGDRRAGQLISSTAPQLRHEIGAVAAILRGRQCTPPNEALRCCLNFVNSALIALPEQRDPRWLKDAAEEFRTRAIDCNDAALKIWLETMARDQPLLEFVGFVFRHSPFLSQCALRDLAFLRDILEQGPDTCFTRLLDRMRDELAQLRDRDLLMHELRITRRRVALLTGIADIAGHWPLDKVTQALSDFADGALSATISHLLLQAADAGEIVLADPHFPEDQCGYVALAMGKHGGRELNYSSDIDLIIIYEPVQMDYRGTRSHQQFAARLTKQLVPSCRR